MARFTPHPAFRHVMPWRLLHWIDDHTDACWYEVVMWKLYGDHRDWRPSQDCFEPYDYCGKFCPAASHGAAPGGQG